MQPWDPADGRERDKECNQSPAGKQKSILRMYIPGSDRFPNNTKGSDNKHNIDKAAKERAHNNVPGQEPEDADAH